MFYPNNSHCIICGYNLSNYFCIFSLTFKIFYLECSTDSSHFMHQKLNSLVPLNSSFSYLFYDSDILSWSIFLKIPMSIEQRYLLILTQLIHCEISASSTLEYLLPIAGQLSSAPGHIFLPTGYQSTDPGLLVADCMSDILTKPFGSFTKLISLTRFSKMLPTSTKFTA